MQSTLEKLADLYLKTEAGKGRAKSKDCVYDYERFLRDAKLNDGSARMEAEADLASVEKVSGGLISIDLLKRETIKGNIRIKLPAGEEWLFQKIQKHSPTQLRQADATLFQEAASRTLNPTVAKRWHDYFTGLSERALTGLSTLPFKKNDAARNKDIVHALEHIIQRRKTSLIRYVSAQLFQDSKRLEKLESAILHALTNLTDTNSLEDHGILKKPRRITFHGNLCAHMDDGSTIDYSKLKGESIFSEYSLKSTRSLETTAPLCLSVENEDSFHELVKRNLGILLICTSYAGAAVKPFYDKLPANLPCYHFGDTDPAGFDILRDLREKTKRAISPFMMEFTDTADSEDLSQQDQKILLRLLESETLSDLHPELANMQQIGKKGEFEQEQLPLKKVVTQLKEKIRTSYF